MFFGMAKLASCLLFILYSELSRKPPITPAICPLVIMAFICDIVLIPISPICAFVFALLTIVKLHIQPKVVIGMADIEESFVVSVIPKVHFIVDKSSYGRQKMRDNLTLPSNLGACIPKANPVGKFKIFDFPRVNSKNLFLINSLSRSSDYIKHAANIAGGFRFMDLKEPFSTLKAVTNDQQLKVFVPLEEYESLCYLYEPNTNEVYSAILKSADYLSLVSGGIMNRLFSSDSMSRLIILATTMWFNHTDLILSLPQRIVLVYQMLEAGHEDMVELFDRNFPERLADDSYIGSRKVDIKPKGFPKYQGRLNIKNATMSSMSLLMWISLLPAVEAATTYAQANQANTWWLALLTALLGAIVNAIWAKAEDKIKEMSLDEESQLPTPKNTPRRWNSKSYPPAYKGMTEVVGMSEEVIMPILEEHGISDESPSGDDDSDSTSTQPQVPRYPGNVLDDAPHFVSNPMVYDSDEEEEEDNSVPFTDDFNSKESVSDDSDPLSENCNKDFHIDRLPVFYDATDNASETSSVTYYTVPEIPTPWFITPFVECTQAMWTLLSTKAKDRITDSAVGAVIASQCVALDPKIASFMALGTMVTYGYSKAAKCQKQLVLKTVGAKEAALPILGGITKQFSSFFEDEYMTTIVAMCISLSGLPKLRVTLSLEAYTSLAGTDEGYNVYKVEVNRHNYQVYRQAAHILTGHAYQACTPNMRKVIFGLFTSLKLTEQTMGCADDGEEGSPPTWFSTLLGWMNGIHSLGKDRDIESALKCVAFVAILPAIKANLVSGENFDSFLEYITGTLRPGGDIVMYGVRALLNVYDRVRLAAKSDSPLSTFVDLNSATEDEYIKYMQVKFRVDRGMPDTQAQLYDDYNGCSYVLNKWKTLNLSKKSKTLSERILFMSALQHALAMRIRGFDTVCQPVCFTLFGPPGTGKSVLIKLLSYWACVWTNRPKASYAEYDANANFEDNINPWTDAINHDDFGQTEKESRTKPLVDAMLRTTASTPTIIRKAAVEDKGYMLFSNTVTTYTLNKPDVRSEFTEKGAMHRRFGPMLKMTMKQGYGTPNGARDSDACDGKDDADVYEFELHEWKAQGNGDEILIGTGKKIDLSDVYDLIKANCDRYMKRKANIMKSADSGRKVCDLHPASPAKACPKCKKQVVGTSLMESLRSTADVVGSYFPDTNTQMSDAAVILLGIFGRFNSDARKWIGLLRVITDESFHEALNFLSTTTLLASVLILTISWFEGPMENMWTIIITMSVVFFSLLLKILDKFLISLRPDVRLMHRLTNYELISLINSRSFSRTVIAPLITSVALVKGCEMIVRRYFKKTVKGMSGPAIQLQPDLSRFMPNALNDTPIERKEDIPTRIVTGGEAALNKGKYNYVNPQIWKKTEIAGPKLTQVARSSTLNQILDKIHKNVYGQCIRYDGVEYYSIGLRIHPSCLVTECHKYVTAFSREAEDDTLLLKMD
jgi:hypothetical protein